MDDLQSQHAEKLRTERHVMNLTGMTRGDLRRNFATDVKTLQTRLSQQILPPAVQPAPAVGGMTNYGHMVETPRTSFTATQRDQCGVGDTAQSNAGVLIKDVIVVLNGTAYYTNILTDGRLDAV